jgi:hypothetical protein
MNPRLIVLCALALMTVAEADAETVYRWVDEAGQVHYSDVVPDAYKKVAQPMDLKASEPSTAEKADAEARAAALKAAADRIVRPSPRDDSAAAPLPSAVVQTTDAFEYTAANCKAWRKRYTQSKACFDGLARPNDPPTSSAVGTCGDDVPNPYPACGAPENYEVDPSDYPWINVPPHHRH